MLGSRFRGKARSTCRTFPKEERALRMRRPKPTLRSQCALDGLSPGPSQARAQQDPVRLKPEAVARTGGIEPQLLRRAEAGQRAAELDARLGSHREVLGTLDQVAVLDLLVVVLHELVAEKGRDQRLIQRKWN